MKEPEKSDEWTNYGDMNPETHGGRFIKWTGNCWEIIESVDLEEQGLEGMIRNGEKWMFNHYYVEELDVFIDGNPENGFTDEMMKIFDSFGMDNHLTPENPEIMERLQYYLVDIPFHVGMHGDDFYSGDYWGYLRSEGIEPEQENGWSYSEN